MKSILSLFVTVLFLGLGVAGFAREAQANKSTAKAEALQACKAEGKIGKELSGCIRSKMATDNEIAQTEGDEDETPPEDGSGDGSF